MYELVWLEHDNYVRLVLIADGAPVSTSAITQVKTVFVPLEGGSQQVVSSTNSSSDMIRWGQSGYETGEIRLFLGNSGIPPGIYLAYLIVYDPEKPDGIVWGEEPIKFIFRPSPL